MAFQTIFYDKLSGQILLVLQNKYIRSQSEKYRLCQGHRHDLLNVMYFKPDIPVDASTHHVRHIDAYHPPVVVVSSGIPLIYADRRSAFLDARAQFKNIIVNMADGAGDNLFRAAAIAEAQRQFPDLRFFCDVYPEFRSFMAFCPDITLLIDYEAQGLDPNSCGHVTLNGGHLVDPRGGGFSKSALYGLYLDLSYVSYDTRLVMPTDFDEQFSDFGRSIGLRDDGRNIVLQLRTKDTPDRGWSISNVLELVSLINASLDCSIFYLGDPLDMPDNFPGLVNLSGQTSWLQTIYILTKAWKIVCIDSAVLHFCRALGLNYFCLWGHTDPWRTLGVPASLYDIGTNFGTPLSLMKDIKPQHVYNRVFSNDYQ